MSRCLMTLERLSTRAVALLLGIFLLGVAGCIHADEAPPPTPLPLSQTEKTWLAAHPVIRIGIDASYAPYSFLDDMGQLQGVVRGFLTHIEQVLGIRFEIITDLTWPQLMDAVKEHHLDAVATVVRLPERETFLEFTRIYLPTPLVVMTRDKAPQVNSLKELEGLRLALVEGYSSSQQVMALLPGLRPFYVSKPVDGLGVVATGSVDAYVGVLGVSTYLASQHGITNLKVNAAFDMAENGQRFGVRKDWPQLAHLLDKALAAMPAHLQAEIFQRWLSVRAEEIQRLSQPTLVTRLFPWLLGVIVLTVLAYLVMLLWNRQLQRELARRRAELERAQAIAHLGDWSLDIASGRIQWSDELFRIAGRPPRELDWPTLRRWIHPDALSAHDDYLNRLGTASPGEHQPLMIFHLRRPDDSSRWLEITSETEFDAQGKPRRHYGTALDITGRKQAEIQARQGEIVLDSVFQTLPDLFFLMDADGTIRDYRARLNSDLYVPPEAFLGKPMQDVLPAELGDLFRRKMAEVRKGGELASYEYALPMPGGIRHFEARLARLPGSAQMIAVVRDISERAKAEALLAKQRQLLADSQRIAHIGSWEIDLTTGTLTWSDETYRIYGVSPATFQPNTDGFLGLIHPDDLPAMQGWIDALLGGRSPGDLEFRIIGSRGEIRTLNGRGTLDCDAGNRPIRAWGTAQDVTVHKKAEIALQEQLDELTRWQAVMLGREDRIQALKGEVNALLIEQGSAIRYPSQTDPS